MKQAHPKVAKLLVKKNECYVKLDHKGMIRVCKEIIKLSDDKDHIANSWEDIGISQAAIGNYDEALHAYDNALEIRPRSEKLWFRKSEVRQRQGDNEGALRDLGFGIEANPGSYWSWKNRAEFKAKIGDNEGALKDLHSGIEADADSYSSPNAYMSWEHRAKFKANLGDHRGAIEDYNQALTLYTQSDFFKKKIFSVEPSLWDQRARSFQALNQHESAIKSLDYLIQICPEQSNVWQVRGNICSVSGYHKEAIQDFEKAISLIEPGSYRLVRCLSDKAAAYVRWEHYEDAVITHKKIISLDPKNYEHWKSLGDTNFAWKKYKEAISCYKKALKLCKSTYDDVPKIQECLKRTEELSRNSARSVPQSTEPHQQPGMPVVPAGNAFANHRQWSYIQPSEIVLGVVIGKGGMGAVYRATWKGQEVAAKKTFQAGFTEVLRNEHAILSRLNHENIIEVYGFTIHAEGEFCLIMNFYSRGSLSENLYSKKNPLAQRIFWAKGVADGLAFLHENKVLHKDLKTDNVLIADDGRPVIADFGLSDKLKSDQTHQSTFTQQGTITYIAREIMCPEKYQRGKASYSPASDIWAQAVLIWSCATEQVPYKDWQLATLLNFIVNQDKRLDIPSSAEVKINKESPGLAKVLAKFMEQCWHTNPAKRPEAKTVSQELEKIYMRLKAN